MTQFLRILLLFVLTGAISACGLFGSEDEELKPAELIDFETTLAIKKLWSVKVGKDAEALRVALRPVGDGARVYAASYDGNVVAVDPESGKAVWRTKLDIDLAAGPGVGEGIVAVVAVDGFLIALNKSDGTEMWRAYISGESLAAPLVVDEYIVVQTVDNRISALSIYDGTERWSVEQETPALTMRGTTSPVNAGGTVVTGFDNGRVVAIDLESGDVEWESLLSPPSGRSDLDRLADIDGDIAVVGQDIYASGYHGRVASFAAESGQILWDRELSSFEGVTADWNYVYSTLATGELIALNRRTGAEVWRQNALLRREPTVPVSFKNAVAVGDLDGYLHFFSVLTGEYVARVRAGGKAIIGTPLVVAETLLVQSDDGTVSAWVVREPKQPKRRAPDTADEEA